MFSALSRWMLRAGLENLGIRSPYCAVVYRLSIDETGRTFAAVHCASRYKASSSERRRDAVTTRKDKAPCIIES